MELVQVLLVLMLSIEVKLTGANHNCLTGSINSNSTNAFKTLQLLLCLQYNDEDNCPVSPASQSLCHGCKNSNENTVAPLPERADLCVSIACSVADSDKCSLNSALGPLQPTRYSSTPSMCGALGAFGKCNELDVTNCEICRDLCADDIKFTVEKGSNAWYLSFVKYTLYLYTFKCEMFVCDK